MLIRRWLWFQVQNYSMPVIYKNINLLRWFYELRDERKHTSLFGYTSCNQQILIQDRIQLIKLNLRADT